MRALSRSPAVGRLVAGLIILPLLCLSEAWSASLTNADFETGDLTGWSTAVNGMTIAASTNDTYNRNYAARISGNYASATWITNSIYQGVAASAGDAITAEGFLKWKSFTKGTASATGYVQVSLLGSFSAAATNTTLVFPVTNNWTYFFLNANAFGIANPGFENGTNGWTIGCDNLSATIATNIVSSGTNSLKMSGTWTNWSWNEAKQIITCKSGDVIQVRGKAYVQQLQTSAGSWVVAGIKVEPAAGGGGPESDATATGVWSSLSLSTNIMVNGDYVCRFMVCGGVTSTNVSSATVYFDDMQVWNQSQATGTVSTATVRLDYAGFSGGASYTSSADVYLDALTLKGSTANQVPATNIMSSLRGDAQTIGTNASASIPKVVYPALYTYGTPTAGLYPSYVEVVAPGWQFQYITNNAVIVSTNTITVNSITTNGPGYIEFDQYIYCGKNPNKDRGQPLEINTNAPYFTLGNLDNSSAEFGNGPFQPTATYVVGTSLTNFPKRMVTTADGTWPSTLNIVFSENYSQFTNSLWNKHFIIASVITNGSATGVKAVKVALNASRAGVSNDVAMLSQEIHMGWATVASCYGLVDYPNVTYQDANQVAVREPWVYNYVDDGTGWFMGQVARGSATIEPIDLFAMSGGNWVQRMYDEVLFTWSHAGAGVRSLFDDDSVTRLLGPASYHVGFKIGHAYGTNAFGGANYPEVLDVRGNGYFRMSDYDGVMAGSFRPMASDQYGLYKGYEDYPLIPKAYSRIVARTTATNQPDNSYGQLFASIRSNTNQYFTGCQQMDLHFTPDEVSTSGCYFDLSQETWAHKANVITNDGSFSLFTQVSMHWRGGSNINDGTEAHDVDVVMIKKTNGEWITHQILNPPTNVYERTVASVASNDVVYLMQQDRGVSSYGFATESPYRQASSFEITLLNDGGLPLNLDVYEQNTFSEIADNVDIICNVRTNIAQGQKLTYKYRYRTVFAPGVFILNPNESGGSENWSTNTYRIEFYATDGYSLPVQANIYYGNGLDSNWQLINTNLIIYVPTNSNYVAYDWNVSNVATGAYYIKVTAQRTTGGKVGFDVSNTRLQVGRNCGFANNGTTNITVTTNAFGYLGNDMSFESGSMASWNTSRTNWNWGSDYLTVSVTSAKSYDGIYSCRMNGIGWSGWSWNNVFQEVPCRSGETLHVTGKIFIGSFKKSGTNWVACGIKMESTNTVGYTSAGQEFNEASPTGSWLTVDFTRTAPVTGTDRLLLWTGGYDGTNADVYFDNLVVTSTNTGVVVTNTARAGYWQGATPVDVSAHNALSFWVSDTTGMPSLVCWAADASGVTNSVPVTNFVDRLISLQRRVDIPWARFTTINKTQVKAIGFSSAVSNNAQVSRMQSLNAPLIARSTPVNVPQTDFDGLAFYYPGQVVTNLITITNLLSTAQTGLTVQAVQEYGETLYWNDTSPGVPAELSAAARRGDRLCNNFEQIWSNQTIGVGGKLVLTNVYVNPLGKLVNYGGTNFVPWYAFRNYRAHAQVHVAVRKSNGDNLYDNDGVGCYFVSGDTNPPSQSGQSKSGSAKAANPSATTMTAGSVSVSAGSGTGGDKVGGGADQGGSIGGKALSGSKATPGANGTQFTSGVCLFKDDFNDGDAKGWAVSTNPNIDWSVTKAGTLQATVVGKGGYSFVMVDGLDVTNNSFSLEYDVLFDHGASEGGVILAGHVLYVSPLVCGWADGQSGSVPGKVLADGQWHHVVVDVQAGQKYCVGDVYVDGKPVCLGQSIELTGKVTRDVGLLSPYRQGTVNWDNVVVTGY